MVSIFPLDVLYALFILAPGFLTYQILRYTGKLSVEVDKFDKAAYTFLASGLAFSILIVVAFIYSFLTSSNPPSISEADYTLAQMSIAYLFLLAIACLNGYLIGRFIDDYLRAGISTRRENTWDLILDNAEEPIDVTVVTELGDEIHGYINIYDSRENGKDILLKYPQKQSHNEGEDSQKIEPGTDFAYINEGSISHVYISSDINVDE